MSGYGQVKKERTGAMFVEKKGLPEPAKSISISSSCRGMIGKRKLDVDGNQTSLLQLAKKATLLGKYGVAQAKAMTASSKETSSDSSEAGSSNGGESDSDGSSSDSSSDRDSSSDDSDSEESEDEAEVEKRMKAKAEAKKKSEAAAQAAIDAWMNNVDKSPSPQKAKKEKSEETSGSKAFRRVDSEVWSKGDHQWVGRQHI